MSWEDEAKAKSDPVDDWEAQAISQSVPQEGQKGLSLLQAAFPGASQERAPVQGMAPFYYAGMPKELATRTIGSGEQRTKAAIGDALSLPTRAAGATAGALGYTGATGGPKPFREALADPETGLARPARKFTGNMVREGYQGGPDGRSATDYLKMGAGGAGYMAASLAEDPSVLAGAAAKAAPNVMGRIAKTATAPLRNAAAELAPMARKAADRVQQTVLRPRQGDWNAGFDLADIEKHGVQGTVDDVIAKSQAKIDDASSKLKTLIKEGKDGGARVDLFKSLDATQAKLAKEAPADLVVKLKPIFKEFRTWAKAEANREGVDAAGNVDLLKAQEFKQMIGAHGAWEKTAAAKNVGISEAERYRSRAAQAVYLALKDDIEKAAPEGVKDLNKTLSDLIPIRNAATYRKIVADRNNPISLTDMLGVMTAVGNGPTGAALLAASRFTKSGFGAKTLYSLAQGLESAKTPAEAAFYAKKLKALGLDAAEIKALSVGGGTAGSPNTIPFRRVAEDDSMNQPQARE